VGGTHLEEDNWGGGVNRDPASACLVSMVQTRSGSRRFGDVTTDEIR
jgi:hypothetical protein